MQRGDAFVDLVNALKDDVKVCVVAPRTAKFVKQLEEGIEVVLYQARNSRFNPFLYLELFRIFQKMAPDVVHTHFAKATQIFYRMRWLLDIVQIATKHNPRKGPIFKKIRNVIAVSEGVKESIGRDGIEVIYNGIQPVEMKTQKKNEMFTFLAVGRLDKIKGFDLLLDSLAQLDIPCQLWIAGEGQERHFLEKKITELGLEERAFLLGFREDIPDLMAASHAQIMSSHSEGFSLAMIEAMFYTPVFFSTNVAGCREVLSEPFLFEPPEMAKKMEDVYMHYNDYVEKFRKLKHQWSSTLNITTCKMNHLRFYKEVLTREKSL